MVCAQSIVCCPCAALTPPMFAVTHKQTELLDPEMNALEYMMREYKDIPLEKMRSVVSGVGVSLKFELWH